MKPEKEIILSITIEKGNLVYVDKEKIPLENLTQHLKLRSSNKKDPGVLLFAQKDISYQELFRILDRIKNAGLSRISLQAELENKTWETKK